MPVILGAEISFHLGRWLQLLAVLCYAEVLLALARGAWYASPAKPDTTMKSIALVTDAVIVDELDKVFCVQGWRWRSCPHWTRRYLGTDPFKDLGLSSKAPMVSEEQIGT